MSPARGVASVRAGWHARPAVRAAGHRRGRLAGARVHADRPVHAGGSRPRGPTWVLGRRRGGGASDDAARILRRFQALADEAREAAGPQAPRGRGARQRLYGRRHRPAHPPWPVLPHAQPTRSRRRCAPYSARRTEPRGHIFNAPNAAQAGSFAGAGLRTRCSQDSLQERATGLEPATSSLGRRPVHGPPPRYGTAFQRVTSSTPRLRNGQSGPENEVGGPTVDPR